MQTGTAFQTCKKFRREHTLVIPAPNRYTDATIEVLRFLGMTSVPRRKWLGCRVP